MHFIKHSHKSRVNKRKKICMETFTNSSLDYNPTPYTCLSEKILSRVVVVVDDISRQAR